MRIEGVQRSKSTSTTGTKSAANNNATDIIKSAKSTLTSALKKGAANVKANSTNTQQADTTQEQAQQQTTQPTTTASASYMNVYNDYASKLNNILQQQKDALNQSTTSQARAAYVANEQSKEEIPRTLSNAGVSGGLAEKVRTNQNTSYQKNLADIMSQKAAKEAEYEQNNANLLNEAYKEALTNQQEADNEAAIAQQQYANQLALQQQQQEYDKQAAQTSAADSIAQAALSNVDGNIYKTVNSKKKLVSSEANQIASIYNTAKSDGASQSTLNQLQTAMETAATALWGQKYGTQKNPKLTLDTYLQRYVYDRIS